MNKNKQTTLVTKEEALKNRKWYLFDAKGQVLGRFAAEVAKVLIGKHKPNYTPHVDTGDGVIIINADKVMITGNKEAEKTYRYYTGYIGGLKEVSFREMKKKKPEYIVAHAIRGMMPKSRLGKQQLKKLKIFASEKHDMEAQKPIIVNL